MGPNATKFTTPVSISTVCPYDAPSKGANEVSDPDFQFARGRILPRLIQIRVATSMSFIPSV